MRKEKLSLQEEIQLEELKKWHLINVQKCFYDSTNNLVIAGLGINPQDQYELYCFKISSDEVEKFFKISESELNN